MTDDIKRNFLGIPIIGTPQAGSTRVDQYSREDFENIVFRVLNNEFFHDFGWTQYTPYFNDGDPCEFGTSGFWIRTVEDLKLKTTVSVEGDGDEEEADQDLFEDRYDLHSYGDGHPTLGKLEYPDGYWVDGYGSERKLGTYVGDHGAEFRLAKELEMAIEGGHFENVLLDLFGDHCRVKVTRTGITIDEYSHD